MPNKETILLDIKNLLAWIEKKNYKGVDHYDLYDNPLFHFLLNHKFIILKKILRKLITLTVDLFPELIIFITKKKQNHNSKALGLILSSYCHLYIKLKEQIYLTKAKALAVQLISLRSNYDYYCWGYPFDWSGTIYIPKNTPSSVVTCIVGEGFYKLFTITNEKEYLDICISICGFILKELNISYYRDDKICFSYTPIDNDHVHNANLFSAEFLIKIGKEINNTEFVNMGIRALNFTLNEQHKDGYILYWAKVDSKHMKYRRLNLDHYHTGFEIRKIFDIYNLLGIDKIETAFIKYYNYYKENMIKEDGTVYYSVNTIFPIDIHSCAEAIILNTHLKAEESYVLKIIEWVNKKMKSPEGTYYYKIQKIGPFKIKTKIAYMRWGQAWMLYALSYYLLTYKTHYEKDCNI